MRNRLAHAYFDVDLDILWDTVTRAVPPVARRVDELLEDRGMATGLRKSLRG